MRKRVGYRYFVLAMMTAIVGASLLAISSMSPVAIAAPEPMEVVKGLVDPALQILNDKATPLKERQTKLRSLVSDNFDFTSMSRSALGIHWKDLNDQQKQEFTQTFSSFLEDSYLSRIQDFSGLKVNYIGATQLDPQSYEVKTTIEQTEGKAPVQVNYMLRQANGKWLVYDVTVDNISIAANYRNQFNRVMNNGGYDTLIADLKRKQQGLEDQLGTPHSHD